MSFIDRERELAALERSWTAELLAPWQRCSGLAGAGD